MTNPAAPASVTAGPGGLTAVQAGLTAERAVAQLLAGPPADRAEQVAERLLAIQGQDQRGARLAVRVRSRGLSAADIDHALTVDRSLVISWLNRGTLHLVRSVDYWPLHRLTTPQLEAGCARRLDPGGHPSRGGGPGRRADRALPRPGRAADPRPAGGTPGVGRGPDPGAGPGVPHVPDVAAGHLGARAHDRQAARPRAGPGLARRAARRTRPGRRTGLAGPPLSGRPLPRHRPGPGEMGRAATARRPPGVAAASRPSWTRARTAWSGWRASRTGTALAGRPEPALPPPRLLGVFDPHAARLAVPGGGAGPARAGDRPGRHVRLLRHGGGTRGRHLGPAGRPGLADPAGRGERRSTAGRWTPTRTTWAASSA